LLCAKRGNDFHGRCGGVDCGVCPLVRVDVARGGIPVHERLLRPSWWETRSWSKGQTFLSMKSRLQFAVVSGFPVPSRKIGEYSTECQADDR
jgi:hypothetical protein